ncbi:hypothetical protein LTR78_005808 [Recurvomyces mirabilis]|uniref:Arb2 domain-containing protein n=1 Tax=Recurvomyces mirabilis TaxID=574656 RepID=A0AAE0WMA4_9PEZI|nr:hypothetical protein LTR78_005808 [Recurvomyces mirabilis]KAK5154188.1 hypothetical protein LTS14_006873 [Recurvomyces mirabilis]
MFRRLNTDLPQDPRPAAANSATAATNVTLASLDFVMNENRHFVKANTATGNGPEEYFNFFHTDNERSNEVRGEAMHAQIKKSMLSELKKLGITEVFIHEGACQATKPSGPHATILASEPRVLKTLKDVIVIVNEHKQDLGVLAYRALAREGGLDVGSVFGLASKLSAVTTNLGTGPTAGDVHALASDVQKLSLRDTSKIDDGFGLLIMNPGELLYSHALNKTMSQAAWLARKRPSALSPPFEISDVNRVPGHETPQAHIHAIFEQVIPTLLAENARIYVIGLSDGGESVLKYMNDTLRNDEHAHVASMIEAVALTEPTHDLATLSYKPLAAFLAACGAKSYVLSTKPKGELLKMPPVSVASAESSSPLGSAKLCSASILSSAELDLARRKSLPTEQEDDTTTSQDSPSSITTTSPPVDIPSIHERESQQFGASTSAASRRSLMDKIATNTSNYFFPARKGVSPEQSVTGDVDTGYVYSAREEYLEEQELMMQTSYPDLKALIRKQAMETGKEGGSGRASSNESVAGSTASQMDSNESQAGSSAAGSTASRLGSTASPTGPLVRQADPTAVKADSALIKEDSEEFGDYEYSKDPVSCPTFSSGVSDLAEMIFPNVMEDILGWFKDVKRLAEESDGAGAH